MQGSNVAEAKGQVMMNKIFILQLYVCLWD
jgi:hypothetical protein